MPTASSSSSSGPPPPPPRSRYRPPLLRPPLPRPRPPRRPAPRLPPPHPPRCRCRRCRLAGRSRRSRLRRCPTPPRLHRREGAQARRSLAPSAGGTRCTPCTRLGGPALRKSASRAPRLQGLPSACGFLAVP